MTTQLLLIRHGASIWNAEGRIQGQADPPLSELGRRQADALGSRLQHTDLAAVYCSPAARAHDTAMSIAAPHGLVARKERGLLEVDLGVWQGGLVSALEGHAAVQYRDWERDPASLVPPKGESLEDALARVSATLQTIVDQHTGNTVVVVTHSIIGRVALSYLLGCHLGLVSRLHMKQASIAKVRIENGVAVLERLSDTKHLLSLIHHEGVSVATDALHQP